MANESVGRKAGEQSDVAANTEALQEQIEQLKGDLASVAATLKDLVRSGVREGRSKAERTAGQYLKQGQEQADAAMESAYAYGEALEGQITKNPFTAVLIALGLGYLVGLMSRR